MTTLRMSYFMHPKTFPLKRDQMCLIFIGSYYTHVIAFQWKTWMPKFFVMNEIVLNI